MMRAESGGESGVHLLIDSSHRAAFVLVSPPESATKEIRVAVTERLRSEMAPTTWTSGSPGTEGNVVLRFSRQRQSVFTHSSEVAVEEAIEEVRFLSEQLGGRLENGDQPQGEDAGRAQLPGGLHPPNRPRRPRTSRCLRTSAPATMPACSCPRRRDRHHANQVPAGEGLSDHSTPVLNNFGLQVLDRLDRDLQGVLRRSTSTTSAEAEADEKDLCAKVPGLSSPRGHLRGSSQRRTQRACPLGWLELREVGFRALTPTAVSWAPRSAPQCSPRLEPPPRRRRPSRASFTRSSTPPTEPLPRSTDRRIRPAERALHSLSGDRREHRGRPDSPPGTELSRGRTADQLLLPRVGGRPSTFLQVRLRHGGGNGLSASLPRDLRPPPDLEGVHLAEDRSPEVVRWSDRQADYRTEILTDGQW